MEALKSLVRRRWKWLAWPLGVAALLAANYYVASSAVERDRKERREAGVDWHPGAPPR